MAKRCPSCKQEKDESEFGRDRTCRSCCTARVRRHRQKVSGCSDLGRKKRGRPVGTGVMAVRVIEDAGPEEVSFRPGAEFRMDEFQNMLNNGYLNDELVIEIRGQSAKVQTGRYRVREKRLVRL